MAEQALLVCPKTTQELIGSIVVLLEKTTDYQLYSYQAMFCFRIVEAVLEGDGACITGLFSRQSGKTTAVGTVAATLCIILPELAKIFPHDPRLGRFIKGFLVGIYAPTDHQAGICYERVRDCIGSKQCMEVMEDLGISVTKNSGDTVKFDNGSRIMARTASPDANIEGETHHLIILDESQDILRSKVEKSIEPMLASTNGPMVKIGTAGESRGGFHLSIQYNLDQWKAGKSKRSHFQFPYDVVCDERRRVYEKDHNAKHLDYERYVEKTIARLGGTNNDEFKMNFMCLWNESRVIAVRPEIFKAAGILDLEMRPPTAGMIVGGLDIGKVSDFTVLAMTVVNLDAPIVNKVSLPGSDEDKQIYYEKTLVDLLELGGPFEGSSGQYRMLVEYLSMTRCQILVVDASGLGGDVVFERINDMIGGSIICVPFKFTTPTKSQLYKYYLQELNARRFRYAAGKATQERPEYLKFQQEHLDLDKVVHAGYSVCQAPDGGHDDYPDACALSCWAEKMSGELTIPGIEVEDLGGRRSSSSRVGTSGGWTARGDRYRKRW